MNDTDTDFSDDYTYYFDCPWCKTMWPKMNYWNIS